MLLVKRDFSTIYKQTVLGPLWFLLQPLFTTIVYTFIFGKIANIGTDGIPQVLFYYSGTILWHYFQMQLTNSMDTFTANAALFSKVYFPRMIVPISKAISNLIGFAVQLLALCAFLVYYLLTGTSVRPNILAIALPLIILNIAMLSTGTGLIISSLTTRYRDLRHFMTFAINLWMYATPVIYPLSIVTGNVKKLMYLNPVTPQLELFRYGFFGTQPPELVALIGSIAASAIIFLVGLVVFNNNERAFVDVV